MVAETTGCARGGCSPPGGLHLGLGHLLEARPDLGCLEPAMAAEGPDGVQLAGTGPAGDGLGVHPEHRRDLGRGEEGFGGVEIILISHGAVTSSSSGTDVSGSFPKVRSGPRHGDSPPASFPGSLTD